MKIKLFHEATNQLTSKRSVEKSEAGLRNSQKYLPIVERNIKFIDAATMNKIASTAGNDSL